MAATKLAEGEELGSNLLRVAQSSLWGPGGPPGGQKREPLAKSVRLGRVMAFSG